MRTRKQKEKIAKRTVYTLYVIFTVAFLVSLWFGIFKHAKHPDATGWMLFGLTFIVVWYGYLGEEILFRWNFNIMRDEDSDRIDPRFKKLTPKEKVTDGSVK